MHERREQIHEMDQLVTHLARGHVARPADDAGRPVGALERGEVTAAPRSGEAGPLAAGRIGIHRRHAVGGVRAVVRRPHHDRVVGHAELVEGVEDAAGEGVDLGQQVGEVAALGGLRELGVRDGRDVDLGVRQVGVERLAGRLRPLHEVDRPVRDLAVEACPVLGVVGTDGLGLLPPPTCASRWSGTRAGSAPCPRREPRLPARPGSHDCIVQKTSSAVRRLQDASSNPKSMGPRWFGSLPRCHLPHMPVGVPGVGQRLGGGDLPSG